MPTLLRNFLEAEKAAAPKDGMCLRHAKAGGVETNQMLHRWEGQTEITAAGSPAAQVLRFPLLPNRATASASPPPVPALSL